MEIVPDRGSAPARRAVAERARAMGFDSFDCTRLVTATSELVRNMLTYAGGGTMTMQEIDDGSRRGLQVVFADRGPGIADVEAALRDGHSTGAGLGLGLSGAKRLAHEFEIESEPDRGTTVRIARWLPPGRRR